MNFEPRFFEKQKYQADELSGLLNSMKRHLHLAAQNKDPEIIFHFSYIALIKAGIFLIAKHNYRVKSIPGHHQKIIDTLSELLNNEDISIIGNKMRKSRNTDLYSSGMVVSEKEVKEYFDYVKSIIDKF